MSEWREVSEGKEVSTNLKIDSIEKLLEEVRSQKREQFVTIVKCYLSQESLSPSISLFLCSVWAAAQSSSQGGTKKPVFLEGKTSITITNNNEHAFDDTNLPAVFYFVDESIGREREEKGRERGFFRGDSLRGNWCNREKKNDCRR